MNFLDKMISDLRGSKEFNQNAGLADMARPIQGYQANGLTDREANALAQQQMINQREAERQLMIREAAKQDAAKADLIRNAEGMSWDGNTGIPQQGLAAGYRR